MPNKSFRWRRASKREAVTRDRDASDLQRFRRTSSIREELPRRSLLVMDSRGRPMTLPRLRFLEGKG